jgi:hypothetical protein
MTDTDAEREFRAVRRPGHLEDSHSHPRSRARRAATIRFVAPTFPIASDM